ncbi:MAG: S8 family serine peptidase [Alphaproteobacteria bacterium]|nr:S8 family serine peptidase [Alphaproteobacteria bacterium]
MNRKRFLGLAIALALNLVGGAAQAQSNTSSVDYWKTAEYLSAYQLNAIDAAKAYALGITGKGVVVGVLDTGIDTRNPEFNGRLLPGFNLNTGVVITGSDNFEGIDTDQPSGRTNHGTHVSGIIAANRDGVGMHGVAFDAQIINGVYDTRLGSSDGWFNESWRQMVDRGVSIINNSSGVNDCAQAVNPPCNVTDYTATWYAAALPQTIAAAKYAAEKDVLMVFATGNESQPSPDGLGAMPYWVPELRNNFLAVGAVDSNGDLASFSNECGVAADWCLVAPGVAVPSTLPLGTGADGSDYGPMDGTSMATPVVTGVAALIKQAFPFFSAHDIQQVLLTTATAMGDRQKFGWGMVNVGRALQGYGQFITTTVVDTAGSNSTLSNSISGSGGLNKQGSGTLTLTGANSYTGETTVNGGQLSINGSVTSKVTVAQNGALRGVGKIDSSLYSAGRLAPGNSPGTLTVNGPVTIAAGATTSFDIDGTGTSNGAGNYSRLITTGSTGSISVNGVIVPVLRGITGSASNSYVAPLGSRYEVIQASTSVTGGFTSLTQPTTGGMPNSTRMDTLYSSASIALVVTPLVYGNLAANGLAADPNQNAVGAALDAVRPAAGPRSTEVFSALYATTPEALVPALSQVAGEVHASGATLILEHGGLLRDALNNRFAPGVAGKTAQGWTSLQAVGGWSEGGGAARMNWSEQALFAGADGIAVGNWNVGFAGGLSRTGGRVDAQNASARSTNGDLAVYGQTEFGPIKASMGAGVTLSGVDTTRAISFGGVNSAIGTSYTRLSGQLFGEVGYGLELANVDVMPFVSGTLIGLSSANFAETGSPFALTGTVAGEALGISVVGIRMATQVPVGDAELSASAMVGWQHVFGDVQGSSSQSLAGGAAFRTVGAGLSRDALVVDLGLNYILDKGINAGLTYSGKFGPASGSGAVKGTLKVSF